MVKQKLIPLAIQYARMRSAFPNLIKSIELKRNVLTTVMSLRPSAMSEEYFVKIVHAFGYKPKAWLLSPEVTRINGKLPHHLYGFDNRGKPQLCVCHPSEWNGTMYLADSFVPWIVTWLNTYEYWLLTEEWHYPEVIAVKSDP